MKELVSLRFIRSDPDSGVNAGEVAGFLPAVARKKVVAKLAMYRNPEDIPDDLADLLEEEDEDTGEGASSDAEADGEKDDDDDDADSDPRPLPPDFPASEALAKAGILTIGAIPRTEEALMEIEGIGQGFAQRILKALAGLAGDSE